MAYYAPETIEVLSYTNERFIAVMRRLVENKVVKNESEFVNEMGITGSHFNNMKKNERFVTVEMLYNACLKFNVNPGFLLPPFEKAMFLKQGKKDQIRMKRIEIEQLKKEIKILESL